jgi:hypothetical protein
MSYSSNHGAILEALQKLVKNLQPDGVADEEIEVRGDWVVNNAPADGISIHPGGEVYDDGTIATMDIGYLCFITFVQRNDMDARLTDDSMQQWRELVRRRLKDQRLSLEIHNSSAPSEHVVKVYQPRDLSNRQYPNHVISQLPVAVWLRELPTT